MTQGLASVSGRAAVRTAPMTLADIRRIAADAFVNHRNEHFAILHGVEHADDPNGVPTTDTVLQPVVDALNAAGVATEATVGGVLASLEVSFNDLHAETCGCEFCGLITGHRAHANFTRLANRA